MSPAELAMRRAAPPPVERPRHFREAKPPVRAKRKPATALVHTCRVCGYTDPSPSRWSGSNHGKHTLCTTCAELQAILVEALRIEHKERRREMVPLGALLNRADELQPEDKDLDEIRALNALADLEDSFAIRAYRQLDDAWRLRLHFLPKHSRRSREALATLPLLPSRPARRASKAAA